MQPEFQLTQPLDARRIVVAMSGGVDSSVVAALAAKTGAEVIGVTLQLYDHGAAVGRTGSCCAGQDIRDARAVADRIGIAHYVFDYESRFRDSVIADFADEYMAGRTPIPCVKCNMGVKFTDLFQIARDLGADCLATGHYVRRVEGPQGAELHRAARAISSSPPHRRSSIICAFRSVDYPNLWCARSPPNWGWLSRSSPIARTSASCPTAIMQRSCASCAPTRMKAATLSISTAARLAVTRA